MWHLSAEPSTIPIIAFSLLATIASRDVTPCVAPPDVIRSDPHFAPTIDRMWRRSPTFRRQLARIVVDRPLVAIQRCWKECQDARALTVVKYRNGVVTAADIRIAFRPSDDPELIAHELEHIIEQLDGVDLPRLASSGNPGVSVDQRGHYETARAHQIGRLAATEYRNYTGPAPSCERTMP